MLLARAAAVSRVGARGLRTSAPIITRVQAPALPAAEGSGMAGAVLAGSPLALTTYDKPFHFAEAQFVFSEKINYLIERLCEADSGVWLVNSFSIFVAARMAVYYFYMQPAYLRHFQ